LFTLLFSSLAMSSVFLNSLIRTTILRFEFCCLLFREFFFGSQGRLSLPRHNRIGQPLSQRVRALRFFSSPSLHNYTPDMKRLRWLFLPTFTSKVAFWSLLGLFRGARSMSTDFFPSPFHGCSSDYWPHFRLPLRNIFFASLRTKVFSFPNTEPLFPRTLQATGSFIRAVPSASCHYSLGFSRLEALVTLPISEPCFLHSLTPFHANTA